MQRFIIQGRLDGLNEYTRANRSNRYNGAKLKKENEEIVMFFSQVAKLKPIKEYPIKIKINWYEPNKKRDIDNITFATKFILDSLVKLGILEDDSQKQINEIEHHVHVDKKMPRIEVELCTREF